MEKSEKYSNQLKQLEKAVKSFSKLMDLNLFSFTSDQTVVDGLKNGQIQKFEYTSELLWKTIRLFLNEQHGVMVNSPKSVYRELL